MKVLDLIKNDPWLEPYSEAINRRHRQINLKVAELTRNTGQLTDFANGHLFFGLHRSKQGWKFREWAPNATAMYLLGDFNHWKKDEKYFEVTVEPFIDDQGNFKGAVHVISDITDRVRAEEILRQNEKQFREPVSYTHLTLPTKRIV